MSARPRFFASGAEFRAWLQQHGARAREVVVGFWKRGTGKPSMTWPESVDQALCFGWIDGRRTGIDARRYQIRFTPRRPRSNWSNLNLARVPQLRKLGLMTPAGEAAFEARTKKAYSYEARPVALAPAFERRLRANRAAWSYFAALAPSVRRVCAFWVMSAKQEATRERRLATLIECSARGEKIPPLRY